MGLAYSAYFGSPDTYPKYLEPPTFDPLYGFTNGRKEREMKVTHQEMETAGLRLDQRDYCAHHLVDFYKCRRDNFPWVAACKDIKHEWDGCQFNDYILRMKEFERERRLLTRAKRRGSGQNSEELGE